MKKNSKNINKYESKDGNNFEGKTHFILALEKFGQSQC